MVYNGYESTFQKVLELNNYVFIQQRNICLSATELYEIENNSSNHILPELFDLRTMKYNLRSQADVSLGAVYTTNHDLRYLKYFAPKIWSIVSRDITNTNDRLDFTLRTKFWIPVDCPFNLRRTYTCQVGT